MTDHTAEVAAAFEEALQSGLEKCGLVAEGYAKKLAPVDTGFLRNSITHALSGEPAKIDKYEANRAKENKPLQTGKYTGRAPEDSTPAVYIGTNVDYATHVEMGTRMSPAQPFLHPAVANHADQYRQILEAELKKSR